MPKLKWSTQLYVTIPSAARALGFKVHALRRAVNSGHIPYYTPFGKRRWVKLAEVQEYVGSCRRFGGGQFDE